MNKDINENEFYVCLLSNGSSDIYKTNVQSAFTNLLRTPCNLNEKWFVGLTEIYFNNNKSATVKRAITAESLTDTDSETENINDEIEVFETRKKIKYSIASELIVNLDEKNYIELTKSELKNACYNKNNLDMNFSNLLRLLSNKTASYENKLKIKDDIINKLANGEWKSFAYIKAKLKKNDYLIHIYIKGADFQILLH
jgi:hypothetical protein